jgi:hypothetical protein
VHAWLLAEDLVQNRIFADLQKSATQHTANPGKIKGTLNQVRSTAKDFC